MNDTSTNRRDWMPDDQPGSSGGPRLAAPLAIIITGHPCTGKTTLARRLSHDLRLPWVGRDTIKELLFESLGWSDRAWSRCLGRASYPLLYFAAGLLLSAGQSAIIESNFQAELAEPDLRRLQQTSGCRLLVIHCQAEPAVILERFRLRWQDGRRHPGHIDDVSIAELAERVAAPERRLALGDSTITLDTTEPAAIDVSSLIAILQAMLAGGSPGPQQP